MSFLRTCSSWLFFVSLVLNVLGAIAGNGHLPEDDSHGAVASEVSECSKIGIKLLKKGGTAADAVRIYELSSQTC